MVSDDLLRIVRYKIPVEQQTMNKPNQEYLAYDRAYDYFNDTLFNSCLPPCLITLQRKKNALGYFSPRRFHSRNHRGHRTDEIALNPDTFEDRSDKVILSTLVHEMVHLWQQHFGRPGRGRYHNQEWAAKMIEVGLHPLSLDNPDKMTGQAVTHKIVPGGPFDAAVDRLLTETFCLNWQSIDFTAKRLAPNGTRTLKTEGRTDKVKHTCPKCRQNAWAKLGVRLICGWCMQSMMPVRL